MSQLIKLFFGINTVELNINDGHIYHQFVEGSLPYTYDFLPLSIYSDLINKVQSKNKLLLDIGANIGDTTLIMNALTHNQIECFEPNEIFFDLLSSNTKDFQNININKKIVTNSNLSSKVKFISDSQRTGTTIITKKNIKNTENIKIEDIITNSNSEVFIKSDTDGFDIEIIKGLLNLNKNHLSKIKSVFFEGPSETDFRSNKKIIKNWIECINMLQDKSFNIFLFSNHGVPYANVFKNKNALSSIFKITHNNFLNGDPMFHYFDILAYRDDVVTDYLSFKKVIPKSFRLKKMVYL